ncbi:MAG TPA: hypothetical protein VMP11_18130 [Verrucomicrobiae bacterium]|nr:hypothetical protein [Verrucomicrobiae bacterium]
MKSSKLWLAASVMVGIVSVASSTYAIPTLFLSDGVGDTVTVATGGDSDTFVGSLGAWNLNVSVGTSLGSSTSPDFVLNNTIDASLGTGFNKSYNLYVWFGNTDLGPSSGSFSATIGGGTTGSVTYNTYADSGNTMFATTMGLTSVTDSGLFSDSASSTDESLLFPYSLSQEVIITQTGPGATSFFATLALNSDGSAGGLPPVPEGGMTLVLLGSSLMGLWAFGRFQKSIRA